MFNRKIGTEGSALQELCLFVILIIRCIITDSTYFVRLVFALIAFVWFWSKLTTPYPSDNAQLLGTEGSALQELCLFVILIIRCIITDSTYFVRLVFALIAFVWFCSKLTTPYPSGNARLLGTEGSALQELCLFVILTMRCFVLWLIVHTLWN